MKNLLALAVFLLCLSLLQAQKYDYNWLAGYNSKDGYDSIYFQHWFGITRFDFSQIPVSITRDSLGINFDKSNSAVSDTDGALLFYCNGVELRNAFDEKIENGDSLSWGYFLATLYPPGLANGLPYNQYHLILPNPKSNSIFDVFYTQIDTFQNDADQGCKKLLRTSVDMSTNNGHGKVVKKDCTIFQHETTVTIAANKHANGKDWWLITYRPGYNCYDVVYYDGSDSLTITTQCAGDTFSRGQLCCMRFSPDGNYFIQANTTGGIDFFQFNRCTGELSLEESYLDTEIRDSSFWWPGAVEFSPDSRYAYVFCNFRIFQFDMLANPISSSKTTIATFSGFNGPFQHLFYYAQLAPDGKIYTNSGNTNYYVGVIDNPNGQGAACNFLDHSIELPTFISGLPYYPNYRLGPLLGSPCDTLGLGIENEEKEKLLRLFPNPAKDVVTIDYGFTDWSKGDIILQITNTLGQLVYSQSIPRYSGFQKVQVAGFASGAYQVSIIRKGQVVSTAKFVKE